MHRLQVQSIGAQHHKVRLLAGCQRTDAILLAEHAARLPA